MKNTSDIRYLFGAAKAAEFQRRRAGKIKTAKLPTSWEESRQAAEEAIDKSKTDKPLKAEQRKVRKNV